MPAIPNFDPETGIHYGAIQQNSLDAECAQEFFDHATDLTFQAYQDEVKKDLRGALEDRLRSSQLDAAVEAAFDAVEDEINENYEADDPDLRYAQDDYVIVNGLSNTIFIVIKSPYFTYARGCSPCVPNAGDLDNPREGGLKTYCLGLEWFGDQEPPYPIYSVATGQPLHRHPIPCPRCHGTSRLKLSDLPEHLREKTKAEEWRHYDPATDTYDCFSCNQGVTGYTLKPEPYENQEQQSTTNKSTDSTSTH